MIEIIVGLFLLIGSFFALVAAIGIYRLPDVLMRMHASTKAGTLGSSLILVGCAFYFTDAAITTRVIATIVFLMLTAPIAAHMLGRAAARGYKPHRKNR
ncbi:MULTISPECIES: monovalent cation/H(+) antiporter subunit G [unclassified Yoonia]|uniref:monovalent cation/H(+) antiporter subunit G n=1 Tax=unclassified Yoonia TaxID=2629118 RepID=UPI002AFEDC52|nr:MULTISPECIES: monovalent cation/H(+) antiporter subunit G [unclassified Yoonia]